jgi:outer membrane protein TolC
MIGRVVSRGTAQRRALAGGLLVAVVALAPTLTTAQAIGAVSGESGQQTYPIDLPTALRLVQAQNLDVKIARERLNEAKANHAGAIAKFLPWISAGYAFRRHEGRTQAVDGSVLDVDKQSIAVGPTITAQIDIGEAIFSSLAARQAVTASASSLIAQQEDSTLSAASNYFDLLKAKAVVDATQDALSTSEQYQQQIGGAVAAGIAFKGDELRVQTQTERYRVSLTQARQQQRAAAAKLAQVLHLDPLVELVPQDSDLVPINIMDATATQEGLVKQALAVRPELKQSEAQVSAARSAKNSTIYGPLIPSLGVQAFLGEFGGGRGDAGGNFGNSKDYYLGLSWRIGPGGLFDFSRINASKARLNTAELNAEKLTDEVKRQVVESYSRVMSLQSQMGATRQSLTTATETLRLTRDRKQLGVGAVLEDIQAQQELARARVDYLSAIVEFDKAQYELNKALGAAR